MAVWLAKGKNLAKHAQNLERALSMWQERYFDAGHIEALSKASSIVAQVGRHAREEPRCTSLYYTNTSDAQTADKTPTTMEATMIETGSISISMVKATKGLRVV